MALQHFSLALGSHHVGDLLAEAAEQTEELIVPEFGSARKETGIDDFFVDQR